jgi:polyribonucleotide nucleotidyltransferase
MDIKVTGINSEIMAKALEQARAGRMHILGEMAKTHRRHARQHVDYAPRIITIKIPVDKIRDVIGPGGKMIRSIIERTGVKIDVEDNGTVNVASADGESAMKAIGIIQELTADARAEQDLQGQGAAHHRFRRRSSRSWRAPTACCTSPRSRTTA